MSHRRKAQNFGIRGAIIILSALLFTFFSFRITILLVYVGTDFDVT